MENKNDGLRFTSPLNNRLHKQWGCFKWTFSLWAPKFSSRAPERSGSVPNTFESHAAVSTSSTVTHSPQSWAELVFVSLAYIKDFACTQESFSCPRETIDGNILLTYALDCNCNSSFIYCNHLPLCITVIFSWRNESTDAHELRSICSTHGFPWEAPLISRPYVQFIILCTAENMTWTDRWHNTAVCTLQRLCILDLCKGPFRDSVIRC